MVLCLRLLLLLTVIFFARFLSGDDPQASLEEKKT